MDSHIATAVVTFLSTAGVLVPAMAFFLRKRGEAAVKTAEATEHHAEAERIEASADAKVTEALVKQLERAEARAADANAEADKARTAEQRAREETGAHRAQVEIVTRTYDERLRMVERLLVLRGVEIDECTQHRDECNRQLAALAKEHRDLRAEITR